SESGSERVGLTQQPSERKATAARFSFGPEALGLDVTYGRITDQEGVLGLVWSNTFGPTPGGEVRFAGVSGHYQIAPRWRVSFDAESGVADFNHAGWLTLTEPLRTTAFSLDVTYSATPAWLDVFGAPGAGALTFSLSQPLRVEDGLFQASLPTATKF